MATALIGQVHVFQVLFVDATNTPIAVTTPTIEVFRFDDNGSKATLVAAGTAMVAVPSDTGRYQFAFTVPDTLTRGDMIYGLMEGIDPSTSSTLSHEQEVGLLSPEDTGAGLIARFVQGG